MTSEEVKNTKPVKRKHKVLSVEDKVIIINRLEKGESGISLAKIYNVGKATISDIKNRKDELLKFSLKFNCKNGSNKRKTMKKVGNEGLENALYSWYLHMRSQGEQITGPLLCARALQLNQIYEGCSEFKASSGWLRNFKCRYSICMKDVDVQGGDVFHNIQHFPAAKAFKEYFKKVAEQQSTNPVSHGVDKDPIPNSKKEQHDRADDTDNHRTIESTRNENVNGTTHAEAFVALETALEWCEQQSELATSEIFILKKMRDLAAAKHKLEWKKSKKKCKIRKSR